MSTVYQATDLNLKRDVAIKIIHPHLTDNPEFLQRFEQEAASVARLRHAHITKVFDFNQEKGVYYMVMEYIAGETLAEKLRELNKTKSRLPYPEIIRMMATICDAVDYAHQTRLIHRDIKPANILIDLLGEPILMDFGVAKMIGGSTHTSTGAAMGTVAYMSPELVQGRGIDHRTDIYSLGIVLYELLSGAPPFTGDSTYEIMHSHVNRQIPLADNLDAATPPGLLDIVKKALAKNPDDRFQSAAEMANALRQLQRIYAQDDASAARHLSRMAGLFQAADVAYASGDYAACLARLAELQRRDADYQPEQTAVLRHQALTAIQQMAEQHIANGRFDQAEIYAKLMREYTPNPESANAIIQAIESGKQRQERMAHLDDLYEEALTKLRDSDYNGALQLWNDLQTAAGDIEYIDRLQVVRRAWDGISNERYKKAQTALAEGRPDEALALWRTIQADNPGFPDRENLEEQVAIFAVQQKRQRQILLAIGGVAAIVLVSAILIFAFRGQNEEPVTTPDVLAVIVPTDTAVPTPSATPLPTATATTAPTATATAVPTDTPTATATFTPTPLPTNEAASPFPEYLATVTEPSSIYAAPSSSATELALVRIDDPIVILARSSSGTWLYVRNASGVTGYIFGERVLWDGDRNSLPVHNTTTTTTTTSASAGPLELDLWALPGTIKCNTSGSGWTQQIYMNARGGNGRYIYKWNDQQIAGPTNSSTTYTVTSGGSVIIGTGSVTSADGQTLTRQLFIPRPNCGE
ncbi:MAG: serine/threonine protein kinase [Candidatus Thermofonsia bacterium]|nr:MAG: serine/threonine protein kinase [Candidatus Thermofonsia bacterium]